MTLEEFYQEMLTALPDLAAASYYDHLVVDQDGLIYPPFIFVHEVDSNPFNADDQVYWIGIENRIDVYTADRDTSIRRAIQNFLNSISISYTVSFDDFDPDLMLYRDSFTIELE